MIRPTAFALALSQAYGTCKPVPEAPLRWIACPSCSRQRGPRLTICRTCDGSGRVAVMQ